MSITLKKLLCFIASTSLTASLFATYVVAKDDETTIEAEDAVSTGSYQIINDSSASAEKYLEYSNGNSEFEFYIETKSDCTVSIRHKGNKSGKALGYVTIDGKRTLLNDNIDGSWTVTEIVRKSALRGKLKITYFSMQPGQMLDSISVVAKPCKLNETAEYLPGIDDVQNLDIPEVKEQGNGNFYFEAEDAMLKSPFQINEDSDASGGKYIDTPTSYLLAQSAHDDPNIFGRFKFNISQKGTYTLWVKYLTPFENSKSSWIAIDDVYDRFDTYNAEGSVTENYCWKRSSIRYLDEGWHTLDIKPRQGGHRLDCFLLTLDEAFTPEGKGSLPGEDIVPDNNIIAREKSKLGEPISLYVNNFLYKTDTDTIILEDDAYLAATTFINALGMQLELHDGYYLAQTERAYIKFSIDDRKAIINGKEYIMENPPYMHDGVIPMISLKAVLKAFGGQYDYIDVDRSLFVTCNLPEEAIRAAEEGEIILEPTVYGCFFEIPCDDPNAKVEAWVKIHYDEQTSAAMQNWKTASEQYAMSSSWKNGYKQQRDSSTFFYWRKAHAPIYKDGAFRGYFESLGYRACDVKVRIIKNGVPDTMIMEKAFKPVTYLGRDTIQDSVPKTGSELLLKTTYENISYYIDNTVLGASCDIEYRINGENEWKKAYTPMHDYECNQFRGSIVMLSPDTLYEVRATIKDGAGKVVSVKENQIRTWTENPVIGEEIKLSDIYDGSGPLILPELQGSEEGWIRIDCEGQEINAGYNQIEAVFMWNCKYLILENAVITGGDRYGINIAGLSENIKIINCDISRWGREGWLDLRLGNYMYDGNPRNLEGGIMLEEATNVTVERCYIHDPNTKTNTWKGPTWKNLHPCGSNAITMSMVSGLVVRYNDFVGSDNHRWNDAMESFGNGTRILHGTGDDSDIYGNMFYCSEDDSIELDGGQMNVRFYRNRCEQSLCGVSTAPNMSGPSYIFRNLITNLGTSDNDQTGSVIKAGGSPDKINGVQYVFNNTFDSPTHIMRNVNYSGPEYHAVTRNNIFVSRTNKTALGNTTIDHRDDNDYDLISGTLNVRAGDEMNALYGLPRYVNMSNGDYRLKKNSKGIDAGAVLDNFSDEYDGHGVDMGAIEYDSDIMYLPYRPVDMYADKYLVELKNGASKTVTVTFGNVEEDSYSIVKNDDYDWITVKGDISGKVKPYSKVTFKISANISQTGYEEGNGMVLFRLSNGYSIPITVFCK